MLWKSEQSRLDDAVDNLVTVAAILGIEFFFTFFPWGRAVKFLTKIKDIKRASGLSGPVADFIRAKDLYEEALSETKAAHDEFERLSEKYLKEQEKVTELSIKLEECLET